MVHPAVDRRRPARSSFGAPNLDVPIPADYDGDGKADLAIYRPTTGQWVILKSTGGRQAGAVRAPAVDVPVPADYDGDGKADIAIYRPTTAQWIILQSTGGFRPRRWAPRSSTCRRWCPWRTATRAARSAARWPAVETHRGDDRARGGRGGRRSGRRRGRAADVLGPLGVDLVPGGAERRTCSRPQVVTWRKVSERMKSRKACWSSHSLRIA